MLSVTTRIPGMTGLAFRSLAMRNIQTQAVMGVKSADKSGGISSDSSSISHFYSGKNLFITGATGFCGKPIIEKLLRSCPDVQGIYCLTRPKKGKDLQERLNEMFNDPIFDRLKVMDRQRSFMYKVHAVAGDISVDNFGLNDTDHQTLRDNINIVLHSAATLDFNEPIDVAVNMNIVGSRRAMELARGMKNLESYLHISTAYTNANRRGLEVKEDVYEPTMPYQELIDLTRSVTRDQLPDLQKRAVGDYPNTYSVTKGLTEHMILQEAGDLPVSIIRPSIVISAYREPSPGWLCSASNHGLASIFYWIGRGNLRCLHGRTSMSMDYVPVDMVTNSALAAIWRTVREPSPTPIIYNVTSSTMNPFTLSEMAAVATKTYREVPFTNAVREADYRYVNTNEEFLAWEALTHWAPAAVRDLKAKISGSPQNQLKIAKFLRIMNNSISYFQTNNFDFKIDNFTDLIKSVSPTDQQEFWMNPETIDWNEAFRLYALGVKKHIAGQELPADVSLVSAQPIDAHGTNTSVAPNFDISYQQAVSA